MHKITKNAIRCNSCGDIIESRYTHDYKTCPCGRVAVDDGLDYLSRTYTSEQEDYAELSSHEADEYSGVVDA